jgi:pimeloyl-ACP methyl ester carboxylesterase
MSSTIATKSYINSKNRRVEAANGTTFAYRDLDSDDAPLVLLQHFRGNLDNWDPAVVDALAEKRRVVTFDNTGVGGSTGKMPHADGERVAEGFGGVRGRHVVSACSGGSSARN